MADFTAAEARYNRQVAATTPARARWFTDARFGMFVHFGVFFQVGRVAG